MAEDVADALETYLMADNALPADLGRIAGNSDIWGSAFEQENIVGSLVTSKAWRENFYASDPTPLDAEAINSRLAVDEMGDYLDRFLEVDNVGHYEAVKADILREVDNRRTLADAGWTGFAAGMVAGVVDLPTLIPIGAGVANTFRGGSLAATAFRSAVGSAVDATITEAALHATQQTRTLNESLANIGGSMILGTILGSGVHVGAKLLKHGEASVPEIETTLARQLTELSEKSSSDRIAKILGATREQDATIRRTLAREAGFDKAHHEVYVAGVVRAERKTGALTDETLSAQIASDLDDVAPAHFADVVDNWKRKLDETAGAVTGVRFKTAKGSTYKIDADGRTVRDKAARPDVGHEGDSGIKDRSDKTVYLSDADANRLAPPPSDWRIIDHGDGTVSAAVKRPDGTWGISPSQKNIRYSTTPEVGRTPLELWKAEKVNGLDGYRKLHFGNKIVEVSTDGPPLPRLTDDQVSEILRGAHERRREAASGGGAGGEPPTGGSGGPLDIPDRGPRGVPALRNPHDTGDVGNYDPITYTRLKSGDEALTPGQLRFAKSFGLEGAARGFMSNWLFGEHAILEMMNAKAVSVRRAIVGLAEMPMMLQANIEGVATPNSAATLRSKLDGIHSTAVEAYMGSYRKWRAGGKVLGALRDASGRDLQRFSDAVMDANIHGDKSDDPHIQAAARAVRSVYDSVLEENIRSGLIRREAELLGKSRGQDADGPIIDGPPNPAKRDPGDDATVAGFKDPQLEGSDAVPEAQVLLGVRRDLAERMDSPEVLDLETFRKAARGGTIGKMDDPSFRPKKRGKLDSKRDSGDDSDLLNLIDTALDKGLRTKDIARAVAHKYGMEHDATYAARYRAYSLDQIARSFLKPGKKGPTPGMVNALQSHMLSMDHLFSTDDVLAFIAGLPKFDRASKALKAPRMTSTLLDAAYEALQGQRSRTPQRGELHPSDRPGDASEASLEAIDFAETVGKLPERFRPQPGSRARDPDFLLEGAVTRDRDPDLNVVKDKEGYIKHVYRSDKIQHEYDTFTELEAVAWLKEWASTNGVDLKKVPPSKRKHLQARAKKHAHGVFEAIVHHTHDGDSPRSGLRNDMNRRGSVLGRNVFISSEELLRRGWIETDPLFLMHKATRENGTDAMVAKNFRRPMTPTEAKHAAARDEYAYWVDGDDPTTVPDLALAHVKKLIGEEYDEMGLNVRGGMDPKADAQRAALRDERAQMLRLATTSVDLLRGVYEPSKATTPTHRAMALVRQHGFVSKMGNIMLSSLSDIGIIASHGPIKLGLYAAKRAAGRAADIFRDKDAKTITRIRREARAASVAIETEQHSRIAGFADIQDPFWNSDRANMAERVSGRLMHLGSRAFGITYWNNAMQRISYGIWQDAVLEAAHSRKGVSKAARRQLAHFGLDDAMLDKIAEQVRGQSAPSRTNGLWMADASTWADRDVASAFYASARKFGKQTILSPDILERPMHMQGPIGSTIFQFTGFVMGSTLRTLGYQAQRVRAAKGVGRDAFAVYGGVSAMMALAALGTNLRYMASDRYDDLPEPGQNPGWWAYEMIDRSGMGGVFTHLGNIGESIGYPSPRAAMQAAFGDDESFIGSTEKSRPRDPSSAVLGAAAGTLGDVVNITTDLLHHPFSDDGRLRRDTAKSIRKLTPIINAWYLRQMVAQPYEDFLTEDVFGSD